jgi:hypothetical protein
MSATGAIYNSLCRATNATELDSLQSMAYRQRQRHLREVMLVSPAAGQ